jgi:hypothetical protein
MRMKKRQTLANLPLIERVLDPNDSIVRYIFFLNFGCLEYIFVELRLNVYSKIRRKYEL